MEAVSKEFLDAKLEIMDTRMASLEAKMDTKFAELRAELHKNTAELVKWIVGTSLAMSAVAITVMTFVLNNAVPKASPYAASTPAPIVIQIPPPPAPPVQK